MSLKNNPVSSSVPVPDFFDRLAAVTESILTRRKRIKQLKRERQAKKNMLADWVESFLWAAGFVLLINQYLVQAYVIPSGSMIDTLLIKDRICVNKLVYGPELLPGLGKLPSPFKPERNDIIIFENPRYSSNGVLFDIAQRLIFMLTFSIVDIDKDEWGQPRPHFLIKRAVGMPGDRIFNREGEMFMQFAGENRLISEREYNEMRGWNHTVRRLAGDKDYALLKTAAKAESWLRLGLEPPAGLMALSGLKNPLRADGITYDEQRLRAQRYVYPYEDRYTKQYYRKALGWYVPWGRALPLGDNRDSSLDGRFFGPVRQAKILGEGVLIWVPGTATEDGNSASAPLNPPPKKRGLERLGVIR